MSTTDDVNATIKRLTRERDEAREQHTDCPACGEGYFQAGEMDRCLAATKHLHEALAASQAECEKLREALGVMRGAIRARFADYVPGDSGCGSGSKLSEHMQGLCACSELREWLLSTPDVAAILSRPPGSREALRAMLEEAAVLAGCARGPFSQAIVARLLREGGSHE